MVEEVRKRVWEGKIALQIELDHYDLTTPEKPMPFFTQIPRISYLPTQKDAIREHFLSSAPALEDEIWFDCGGTPLKWHLPVGILFDLYGSSGQLPWKITVHFQGFPSDQLLRCKSSEDVMWSYLNSLKEGTFLRCGSTRLIMDMDKQNETLLWDAVQEANHEIFERLSPVLSAGSRFNDAEIKHLPLRMVFLDASNSITVIQRRVDPKTEEGADTAVRNVIEAWIPPEYALDTCSILVHGIPLDQQMSARWYCENMPHPDGFVYIIVKKLK